MKTFFLLVLLTQNGAGDINSTFVNTETLQQCQQKAALVRGVFQAAKIPVIASSCIESDLRFTEFTHAQGTGQTRYFYLVKIDDDLVQISVMPDWQTCMKQQQTEPGQGSVYCSSSIQAIR